MAAGSLAQSSTDNAENCSRITQGSVSSTTVAPISTEATPTHHFDVIARYPHDQNAFTQGLVVFQGELYESTGIRGRSSVRRLDLASGRVLATHQLERSLFGEGLTVVNEQLVQLTWKSGSALIYAPDDLHQTGSFTFTGEGWGNTRIGTQLVISDGSSWLKFLDAGDYRHTASLRVTDNGRPLQGLNELEMVDGLIYANVYPSDCIAQIDPRSGNVVGWIDLGGLMPLSERSHSSAVANGIAYNARTGDLFVTGKLWPYIYQLKLQKPEVVPRQQTEDLAGTRRATVTMISGR